MDRIIVIFIFTAWLLPSALYGQEGESEARLSGSFFSDGRFLLGGNRDWVWNENRLSLKLDQRMTGRSRFHANLWARTIGIPEITRSAHLYNKGISDPLQAELREAWVLLEDFLLPGVDVTVGRQRLAWGTADGIGPTDLLNPSDMEDILDFGRKLGADGVSVVWYPWRDFSFQTVYLPRFRPASLPLGVFAEILTPPLVLPMGMMPGVMTDTVVMPSGEMAAGATLGFRAKGFYRGVDLSVSYQLVRDGLPHAAANTISSGILPGSLDIHSRLEFARYHVAGADFSTSLAGIGVWGEAALHIPAADVIMRNDLTPLFPQAPEPVLIDSVLLSPDEPYTKWLVGADYHFSNGSYLNIQYLKGFIHEQGRNNLDSYLFLRYELNFLRDRLKVAPVNGAFVISDFEDIPQNHAIIYMPEVSWQANPNATVSIAAVFFRGKGDGIFSRLTDYSQMRLRLEWFF